METSFTVRSLDATISLQQYEQLPKMPLYVILDNLRSAFNVGAIFRLCDTLRVSGLFLCGYTAHPPHLKLEKTSLGTLEYVPWRHFETTLEAVELLQGQGITVWAAETAAGSMSYLEAPWRAPLGLVLGNEALGVSQEVLQRCDGLVEIPLYGFKNSMNVATAAAVLGFKFAELFGVQRLS
jgi:tRNA G18 (ribose-2'-O)-methylase SpoU